MSRRYVLVADHSGNTLTFNNRFIVHDDPAELEFLVVGAHPVEIGPMIPPQDTIPLREHPDFAALSWPIRREDFHA